MAGCSSSQPLFSKFKDNLCNPIPLKDLNFLLLSLLSKPGIQYLDVEPRTSRIRWLGHVERSTGWIAEVSKLNVVTQKRRSRPKDICDDWWMTK